MIQATQKDVYWSRINLQKEKVNQNHTMNKSESYSVNYTKISKIVKG